MARGTVEEAAEHWDRNYAKVDAPIRDWLESPHIKDNYTNVAISGNPACGWLSYAAETYLRTLHPKRLLDVGCGRGGVSVTLTEAGIVDESIGIDVSAEGIAGARLLSAEHGTQDKTRFECADVSELDFPDGHFEAIIINMALHHMLDLEQIMRKIKAWKAPGAPLILHEYIGPNRFQWVDAVLRVGTAMLESMPRELRVHGVSGQVVERLDRPPYAACSSATRRKAAFGRYRRRRRVLLRTHRPQGFRRHAAAADFRRHHAQLRSERRDGLFDTERNLLRSGIISSNFALMIYR